MVGDVPFPNTFTDQGQNRQMVDGQTAHLGGPSGNLREVQPIDGLSPVAPRRDEGRMFEPWADGDCGTACASRSRVPYCCVPPVTPSPSNRGIPKCPRRWSRSTGLRLPATVTSVRLFGVSARTTAPRTFTPSITTHKSVVPLCTGPPDLAVVTRCFQPRR